MIPQATAMVLASFAADSLALGAHWMYDTDAIDRRIGREAYFYARDIGRVLRMAGAMDAGMGCVNSVLLANEVAPFGGIKQSGLGREGARERLAEYLEMLAELFQTRRSIVVS